MRAHGRGVVEAVSDVDWGIGGLRARAGSALRPGPVKGVRIRLGWAWVVWRGWRRLVVGWARVRGLMERRRVGRVGSMVEGGLVVCCEAVLIYLFRDS